VWDGHSCLFTLDAGKNVRVIQERDMATIDVHNLGGAKVGTLDLADEVFGAVNEDLLSEAITHYRAARRAGTHATKVRGSVSGSGKKLWKQKGTGRARIGSVRSPIWRHGGTVHGPQPRSYDYAFPKKKLLGALRSALAAKFADGTLIVVNSFDVKEPKTKAFHAAITKLAGEGTTLLVEVSSAENRNLELSSRNIHGLELVRANEVHPYHLMRYTHTIFAQPALERLQDSLKKTASRRDHSESVTVKAATKKAAAKKAGKKAPAARRARKGKAEVA
jgi:large subunit ribosomal protein L4